MLCALAAYLLLFVAHSCEVDHFLQGYLQGTTGTFLKEEKFFW